MPPAATEADAGAPPGARIAGGGGEAGARGEARQQGPRALFSPSPARPNLPPPFAAPAPSVRNDLLELTELTGLQISEEARGGRAGGREERFARPRESSCTTAPLDARPAGAAARGCGGALGCTRAARPPSSRPPTTPSPPPPGFHPSYPTPRRPLPPPSPPRTHIVQVLDALLELTRLNVVPTAIAQARPRPVAHPCGEIFAWRWPLTSPLAGTGVLRAACVRAAGACLAVLDGRRRLCPLPSQQVLKGVTQAKQRAAAPAAR